MLIKCLSIKIISGKQTSSNLHNVKHIVKQYDFLGEDTDDQDPFDQSYDKGLENCYILEIKLQMGTLSAL